MMQADVKQLFQAHMALFAPTPIAPADYAALWADDAVVELPYENSGRPNRFEGREAIVGYMLTLPNSAQDWHFSDYTYTVSADGSTAFVEFAGSAYVPYTGKHYRQQYVIKLVTRDGRLVLYREYRDSLAILDAFVKP